MRLWIAVILVQFQTNPKEAQKRSIYSPGEGAAQKFEHISIGTHKTSFGKGVSGA